ncbi:hypothetical protein PENSPDRAFT_690182 [Peniophora sp. CONT]|nr:hypothetical protein PENSPDRAFT_690182 [Peniophora sp. CONT]
MSSSPFHHTDDADPRRSHSRDMPAAQSLGTTRRSSLHALVIGIDKYQSDRIPNLHGAVADADAIVEYLQSDLHVPRDQISNLRNEEATRDAIIQGFRAFQTQQSIKQGDPILIFYAGHGTTAEAPRGWVTASKDISLLVPYDFSHQSANNLTHAIPDRTIGALLHELAEPQYGEGKGDNITLILDCCSSGSGTRRPEYSHSHFERCFGPEERASIPSTLDEDIWGNVPKDRSASVLSGFFMSGSSSHVLLAACRESEHARERQSQGMFTGVLLEALREVATDKVTYRELMARIRNIPHQTPQCEGRNTDRILFAARAPSKGRLVHRVLYKAHTFIMEAGAIHSVTGGAQFAIYASKDLVTRDPPLAWMVASEVRPFSTVLRYVKSSNLAAFIMSLRRPVRSWFAMQTPEAKVEAFRIHIQYSKTLRSKALDNALNLHRQSDGPGTVVCEDRTLAHLSVVAHDDHVEYTICDPAIINHGLPAPHHTTMADSACIYSVLNAAAHFFWHLGHSPMKKTLRRQISVQMFKLMKDGNSKVGRDLRRPWIPYSDNLLRSDIVEVEVEDGRETAYGFMIKSDVQLPLHVWMFYFDCNDLSISEYYRPPVAGRGAEPSLPANGILPIGFGAGGARPFKFTLKAGQHIDVGFLRIFVSTEQVDLSRVEQCSPFEKSTIRGIKHLEVEPEAMWDTYTIAVLQHRRQRRVLYTSLHTGHEGGAISQM